MSIQKMFWFYLSELFHSHSVLAETIKYVWRKRKIPPSNCRQAVAFTHVMNGVRNRANRGASNDKDLNDKLAGEFNEEV